MNLLRLIAVLSAALIFSAFGFSQSTIFEAEDCTLAGNASISTDASLSGGKYVAIQEGSFSHTFTIADEGYFDFSIYASSGGEKYNSFVIDGNSASFGFSEASPYVSLKVAAFVKLAAGQHTFSVEPNWGWINIDYIEMTTVDPASRFDIAENLVTPNPTPEAAAIYDFLKDQYGQKILSGVMTLKSMDMNNWLKTNTGKEPVILGIDFLFANVGYSWYDDHEPRADIETWYNKNGIPVCSWHWVDPSDATNEFYVKEPVNHPNGTEFDSRTIFDKTSADYDKMIADIDFIAGEFKYLQDKNIPVVWRPLHEASGGWFWWGANGPEACKEIWHVMFDRMVNYHGLHNIIWVWTHQPGEDPAWYPGDEYVDIIGQDIYKDGDHGSQVAEFNNTNDRYSGKKLVTESECGSFPDPDNLILDQTPWSWFMPWYGDFVTDGVYNSLALWQKTMDHEYVITLDEMPDLRTYSSATADNADLKSLSLSHGVLSADFDPVVTNYTVYLQDGTTVPVVSGTAKNNGATVTVSDAQSVPGNTTVTVESKDKSTTQIYTLAFEYYIPVVTEFSAAPLVADVLINETASFSVILKDQFGVSMSDPASWTLSGGGTLSSASAQEVVFTSSGAEGAFTLTVTAGSFSEDITINTVDGYSAPVPLASNWEVFNLWNNQDGATGSSVTDGTGALAIDHIQWGYGELWLVNSGVDLDIEIDTEYEISFDFQDDQVALLTEVQFGFADTWDGSGVTAFHSDVASATSLASADFGTVSGTVTAHNTGTTNLFIVLKWGADPVNDKPATAYSSLLKNIQIKPKTSALPIQTIVLDAGWNLMSTYRASSATNVKETLPCATKVKDQSSFYDINQASHLNSLLEITPNAGYIVYTPDQCTVTIDGPVVAATSVNLATGWNLVGYPHEYSSALETQLSGVLSNVTAVKDFDTFWKSNLDGGLDTFYPGKAYFIYVTTDCTLVW